MRGQPGIRPLAITAKAEWDTSRQSFQAVLKKKTGKYGKLEMPLSLRLTPHQRDWAKDQDDVIDALFGSDVVEIIRTGNGFQQTTHTKEN